MKPLVLPPELQACVTWLRAVNQQSWLAPAPPPLPARPADAISGAFYDYLAPVFTETVRVWGELASFRTAATAPYDPNLYAQASVSAP
jgi:hypothetical protein